MDLHVHAVNGDDWVCGYAMYRITTHYWIDYIKVARILEKGYGLCVYEISPFVGDDPDRRAFEYAKVRGQSWFVQSCGRGLYHFYLTQPSQLTYLKLVIST